MLDSVDHAREDFTARRLIELKNKAEGDLRHTEKGLAPEGANLTDGAAAAHRGGDGLDAPGDAGRRTGSAARSPRRTERSDAAAGRTLMNAVVQATLRDRNMEEINPNKL